MQLNIHHDLEAQEFTAALENDQAELSYARPEDKVMDFQHSFVPESFRGNGVADQLILAGLRYAQEQQFRVIASCPVVAAFIRRHKQYQPLLKSSL